MSKKIDVTIDEDSIQIPIHFNMPVGMPSVYATNMIIQASEHEVIISFFEAQPPLFSDDDTNNIEVLQKVGIRADCVAKVTIAKNRISGFAKIIKNIADQISKQDK